MTTISELTATDEVQTGDLFALWATANGDTRKVSVTTLLNYLQDNLTFPNAGIGAFDTQYSAPSATGFSVTITPATAGNNVHLILTPTGTLAAGTLVLPAVATVSDKQLALVNCTQDVTSLTVDANGATAVTGAPSSLTANDFFTLKYDAATSTWYRVA